jgi:hypothetical protein
MASYFVGVELILHPLTLDFSTWYAGSTIIALLVAAGLMIYGFSLSLAGRTIFRDELEV